MMIRFALVALLLLAAPRWLAGQLIEDIEDGVALGAVPSEIQPPISQLLRPLLETICPGHVIQNSYFRQLGCDGAVPEPGDSTWRPPLGVNGILHGHFLSPTSEDVILSGNRFETHPYRWGGTLLMTKQNGEWKPLWYRAGIITRHCMTVATTTGRQILVCESGYQISGHKQHALYSLDLQADNPVQELLIATDSYDLPAENQTQTVASVRLIATADGPLLRVGMQHARYECHKQWYECGGNDFVAADPPPGEYSLDFVLQGSRLVISPASTSLFRRIFPELAKHLPEGLISNGEPPSPH
ncbi:MAG: hypothetical protein HYX73_05625 [Acidobacteria bacterium]|nr:hypothetical protein [Acidobacteriota bacterium]